MAQKLLKKSAKKIAPKKTQEKAETGAVLVGTYKEKQLAWIKKNHVYNYPVKDGDEFDAKAFAAIRELWLYADVKGTRHAFEAEFVGKMTKDEFLAANPTYAKLGQPKSKEYYVFKTKPLDYGPRLENPVVVDRTADFGGRSQKVKQAVEQFKADGEFAPLEHYLPADLAQVPRSNLRVCEAAVQLEFLTTIIPPCADGKELPMCTNELSSLSFSNDFGALYLGDSLVWLKGLPSASVDLVFADPPYSIGKAKWDLFNSHEDYLKWCEAWVSECSRVLTDQGTCYICGFSEILADVKYRTQRFFNGCRWIVWHYKNKANLGLDWGRSHESLLHFRKARSTFINVDDIRIPYSAHTLKYPVHPQADSSAYGNGKSAVIAAQWRPNEKGAKPKDVFDIPTTCNGMGEKTPHPTQKPEELVRKLVLASSHEGDLVLDPFSGSGTTAVVAQQLHRRWLACDKEPEYNQWAVQRITHVPDRPVQYWIDLDRDVSKRRESIR